MNKFGYKPGGCVGWCVKVLVAALMTGCGSRAPVLGSGDLAVHAPEVTLTSPSDGVTGVATNTLGVTVSLNEPIAPLTVSASLSGLNWQSHS